MAPKRIIGDAKDERDPGRVAQEALWREKNLSSSNPSSLGASRHNTAPAMTKGWCMGETRLAIWAEVQKLEGGKTISPQQKEVSERAARRKVYEDMYAEECGGGEAAALAINVEFYIDAQLWRDRVQIRTKEPFPWKWPELFQADKGYADFVESKAHRDSWVGHVKETDKDIRAQRLEKNAETEEKMKAEGKDWADLAAPINEVHTLTSQDKDGKRALGEATLVVRTKTSPAGPALKEPVKEESVKEPAKKEPAKEKPAQAEAGGEKEPVVLWTPEKMTGLYRDIFGRDAACLEGMGGFELPLEGRVAFVVRKSHIDKATDLFPKSIVLRPVTLGWGRVKLCLQFAPWVSDQKVFPLQRARLVWSWHILLKWKEALLKQASDADKAGEPMMSKTMYQGIREVVEEWTERVAMEQDALSVVDEAWVSDAQADRAGLEDEASKQRLYDAVSKVIASSRDQDDVARAHRLVDWASEDPEGLGAGPRTRTYLAVEAMRRYCESTAGEEKLGVIARQMILEKHASGALLKVSAAKSS